MYRLRQYFDDLQYRLNIIKFNKNPTLLRTLDLKFNLNKRGCIVISVTAGSFFFFTAYLRLFLNKNCVKT